MNFSNAILAELSNREQSIAERNLMLYYNNSALRKVLIGVHYYDTKEVSIEATILREGIIEHQFAKSMSLLEWVQMQEGVL